MNWIPTIFKHPITHIEDIRKPDEILASSEVYNQYYRLPEDCENGDNVGKVNFLWSHQKFANRRWGSSFSDSSYTFEIISGNTDGAFSIGLSDGELVVVDESLFVADRFITVRIKLFDWYYQDTICKIEFIPAADCVYFDSTVTGTNGSGTRIDPYGTWSAHAFGGANIGNGSPGKTYLWKRGQIHSDFTKVKNPLIAAELPPWISYGAWGQGALPILSGNNRLSSERFVDLGSSALNGTTVTNITNPEYVAHRVQIMDIETDYDGVNGQGWYPYQIAMYGRQLRFHRLKCSYVVFPWEQGFFWFRDVIAANDYVRQIYMQDIETYDSEYRGIKFEAGDVVGRNFRGYTTLAATETPVSAANYPDVDLKYGDIQCTDNTKGLGLQIRARNHVYEWFYLKGVKENLIPFSHISHNDSGSEHTPSGHFRNILIDDCKANVAAFYNNGATTNKVDGVLFQNIDVINSGLFNKISVGDSSSNIRFRHVATKDITVSSGTDTVDIENCTVSGIITREAANVNVKNCVYGSLVSNGAGAGTDSNNVVGLASADFIDSASGIYRLRSGSALIGAGLVLSPMAEPYDIDGNEIQAPPSIGAYEEEQDVRNGTLLYFDDFDAGTTDDWNNVGGETDSTAYPGTGSSVVVVDQSYSQGNSLRMRSNSPFNTYGQTNNFRYGDVDNNSDIFVKMKLFLPQKIDFLAYDPQTDEYPFFNLLQFKGVKDSAPTRNDPIWVFGLGVKGGRGTGGNNFIDLAYTGQFWDEYPGNVSTNFVPEHEVELPIGQWFDFAVRYRKGESDGRIDAWVGIGGNVAKIYELTGKMTNPVPYIEHLYMSVNNYAVSTTPAEKDVFMDYFEMSTFGQLPDEPVPPSPGLLVAGLRWVIGS